MDDNKGSVLTKEGMLMRSKAKFIGHPEGPVALGFGAVTDAPTLEAAFIAGVSCARALALLMRRSLPLRTRVPPC